MRLKDFLRCNLLVGEEIVGSFGVIPTTVDCRRNAFLGVCSQLPYHCLSPLIA